MRQPNEWDENDLLLLITNRAEESPRQEYKRYESLLPTPKKNQDERNEEVSKDVSSFANAAGGIIIYGMKESDEEPHFASELSPIDPAIFSKERLEQVIQSRIEPPIPGLLIHPIELRTTHPGKFAYVVVVPESTTAHQASDGRYYLRYSFSSLAMDDYQVRQTMNRGSRPSYSFELGVSRSADRQGRFGGHLENISEMVGHDVSVICLVPKEDFRIEGGRQLNCNGRGYTPIPGDHTGTMLVRVLAAAAPFVSYKFEFQRSIVFRDEPFLVIVRVFDQFGMALEAHFNVDTISYKVARVYEKPIAGRNPDASAGARTDSA